MGVLLAVECFVHGWRFGLAYGPTLGETNLSGYDRASNEIFWAMDHGILPQTLTE